MQRKRHKLIVWATTSIIAAALATTAILGWLSVKFGSLTAAAARLAGQHLVLVPQVLNVGSRSDNEEAKCMFTLVNLDNQPIRIMDVQTSCGCIAPSL